MKYAKIFPKILNELKREISYELPSDYIDFLKFSNGINLFSNSICIYGFGRIKEKGFYVLPRDKNIVLPFHLGDYNKGKINHLVVGSFFDNKLIYNSNNKSIYLLKENQIYNTH